jgi:serine protease Do
MSKKQLLVLAFVVAAALGARAALAQSAPTAPRGQSEAVADVLSQFFSPSGGNFLGVHTEDVTRDNMSRYNLSGGPRGVGVSEVVADGPAAKAGVQKGDVIVRFDGETVTSAAKLQRLIAEAAPEQTVQLGVLRGGSERSVTVKLGRRESAARAWRFEGGELRGLNDEQLRRQAEEWKRFGEEWKRQGKEWERHGEEWKRQADELRWQLEKMPSGNYAFALGAGRRIGVASTPLTDQLAAYFGVGERHGVLVTSVAADSPAAKAGLKAGDVITEADGEKIESGGELSRVINRKQEGDVTLTVVRDRNRRTVRVTPEKSDRQTLFDGPGGALRSLEWLELPDGHVIAPLDRAHKLVAPRITTRLIGTPRVVTPRVVTPRVVAPRVVSPRLVAPRLVAPKVITPRVVVRPRAGTIIL